MLLAVPAGIGCRFVEPEVGAEVDEADPAAEYLRCDLLRMTMGQGSEDQADPVERCRLEPFDDEVGKSGREMRVDRPQFLPGLAVAEQPCRTQLRVSGAQP